MIYLEYEDHHNPAIIYRYENEEQAIEAVKRVTFDPDPDQIREELFGEDAGDSDMCCGVYGDGGDTWTVVNVQEMRNRAARYTACAEAMERGEDCP